MKFNNNTKNNLVDEKNESSENLIDANDNSMKNLNELSKKNKSKQNISKYDEEQVLKPPIASNVYNYQKNKILDGVSWFITFSLLFSMLFCFVLILINNSPERFLLGIFLLLSFGFVLSFFKSKELSKLNTTYFRLKEKINTIDSCNLNIEEFKISNDAKIFLSEKNSNFISTKKIPIEYFLKESFNEIFVIVIFCILAISFSRYMNHEVVGTVLIFLLTVIISYYISPKWKPYKLKYKLFSLLLYEMSTNIHRLIKNENNLKAFLLFNMEESFLNLIIKAKQNQKIDYMGDVLLEMKNSNYNDLINNSNIDLEIHKYKNLEDYFNKISTINNYINKLKNQHLSDDATNMLIYHRLNQDIIDLLQTFDFYLQQVNGKLIVMNSKDDKEKLYKKAKKIGIYLDKDTLNIFNNYYNSEWYLIVGNNYMV